MFSRPDHPKSQANTRQQALWLGCRRSLQAFVATATFTGFHVLPWTSALAASPAAGAIIENQATGSFIKPADGSRTNIESNVVQVTIAEVAGVTLTATGVLEAPNTVSNPGPNQDNGIINAEDIVYFVFQATNVGNDPTQFFIPGAPSNITGGTQAGQIEIIEVDIDGPSGATAPTDFSALPVTIRPEGNNTGDATSLGLPVGALPAGGTITLRVPIKLDSGLNPGDTATVVLGDTGTNDNSAGTQNQPYEVSGLANPPTGGFDFYTHDNADTDGITDEANGDPVNGDTTFHRQEASAFQAVTITDPNLDTDYGDAPDTGAGTSSGNYQTTSADSGPAHTISPDLYIGTAPDGDDGTQQNVDADMDDTEIAADEGAINLPIIANNASTYTVSDIAVTNNTANTANLVAWIDFNQDGVFDSSEAATVAVPNTGSQTVSLTWSSLPGLTGGQTYARFRLTTDTSIATGIANTSVSTGTATDGEVEDYAVTVTASFSISGTLYEDIDGNDGFDASTETTLPADITIRLLSSDGSREIATTTTGANGFYEFTGVVPGSYVVQVATTDPQIPLFLQSGTTNPISVNLISTSFTGIDFGFDRRTLINGGIQPACDNPYGEVYSVSSYENGSFGQQGKIHAVHGDTGNVTELTTTTIPGITAINGAATDHVNRLVYYGNGNSLYAWDAINDDHFTVTNNFQQELTDAGYSGTFVSLSSGGAAFYNGSLYAGVDGSRSNLFAGAITQDFEIFKIDFTADGRTITNVTPLNMVGNSSGEPFALDQDTEDWGDFIIDNNGVILGNSTNRDASRRHLWNFDLNTNQYTDRGLAPDNYQLAKDGDGRLWGLGDAQTIQELNVDGSLIGIGESIGDYLSYDAAECVQGRSTIGDRIWNDLDGDSVQDPGEPGIPGVTVGIYRDIGNNGLDNNDPLLHTLVTDANGNYDFVDLLYGNYIVRILEGTPDDQDSTNALDGATLTTTTTTPNGEHLVTLPTGIQDYNDADFGYQVVIAQPDVVLVKRITSINGQAINPNDGTVLNAYVDNPDRTEDNNSNWPDIEPDTNPDLYGAWTGGLVKPVDEVEYTIYFLSTGEKPANNVLFCDRVPDDQTFVRDAFNDIALDPGDSSISGEDRGIVVETGGNTYSYTNIGGDDMARFYPPGSGLPPACNVVIPNTQHNGAIVVDLGNLPNATSPGTPANSYGYVRFRATVN